MTGKGSAEVELYPGQFVFGRKTAAKELAMTESTIRNRMEKLKRIGNLDIKPDTHFSIVTVCNWERYQANEIKEGQAIGQAKDRQRTGKGHKQEGKEGKKRDSDTKTAFGSFSNVILSEGEFSKLQETFGSSLTERIDRLSEYMASKGKRYKSHYATILAWARKDGFKKEEW